MDEQKKSSMNSPNFVFSNLPPATPVAEDFSNALRPLLMDKVRESVKEPLNEQLTELLLKFEKDLDKKVQQKTINAVLEELNCTEEEMSHQIGQELLEAFKKKFPKLYGSNQKYLFSSTSQSLESTSIKDSQMLMSSETDESLLSIPASQTNAQEERDLDKNSRPRSTSAPESKTQVPLDLYQANLVKRVRRDFLSVLLLSSFFWGLVGVFVLTLFMPSVFFRSPQILLSLFAMLISVGIVNSSETRYFKRTGLFVSLQRKHLVFRPLTYVFKLFLCTVPVSFLFLTNVRAESFVFPLSPSAATEWWFFHLNSILQKVFVLVPPKIFFIFQQILFYSSLAWVFLKIFWWMSKKSEV